MSVDWEDGGRGAKKGENMYMREHDVLNKDLNFIIDNLKKELNILSGKNLLITGAAGFLGYYLTQSILYWNDHNENKNPTKLWVYDNFI